jgi:hypothetical protein
MARGNPFLLPFLLYRGLHNMSDWKIVVDGVVKDFQDDYNYRVEHFPGTGMPPLNNIFTNFALLDGSTYQRTRAENRVFSLIGTLSGSSVSDLHLLRKNLIDAVKPDRTASPEAVELQYTGAGSTLQGSVFYDAGLEFGQPEVFSELQIGLRFVMPNPYWEKTTSTSTTMENRGGLTYHNFLYTDGQGNWSSASFNDDVLAVAFDASANLYVGGDFTTINGSDFPYIAKYDGTDWTSIGSMNGDVRDIVPFGNSIYVAGSFTGVSGSTDVYHIAKYDGSTWTKLASGVNGTAQSISLTRNDILYVAGQQDAANQGDIFTGGLSQWNGSTWSAVGACPKATIRATALDSRDNLYIGGISTSLGASAASYVDMWNGANWASLVGASLNSSIWDLAVGIDDTLYVTGCFTDIGGTTFYNVAHYDGVSWKDMAGGTGGTGCALSLEVNDNNGIVHMGGDFLKAGSLDGSTNFVQWKGTSWALQEVEVKNFLTASGGPPVNTIAVDPDTKRMAVGLSGSATILIPAASTLTNNGTAIAEPTVIISDSASFRHFINNTSDKIIRTTYFVNAEETVTLNLANDTFESDIFGNIINTITTDSHLSTWKLLPGDNAVNIYAPRELAGPFNITIKWRERFWSLDGGS